MSRPNCQDFRHLFVNDTPLMDMRAPIEFQQGAFPTSTSLPLMTDDVIFLPHYTQLISCMEDN